MAGSSSKQILIFFCCLILVCFAECSSRLVGPAEEDDDFHCHYISGKCIDDDDCTQKCMKESKELYNNGGICVPTIIEPACCCLKVQGKQWGKTHALLVEGGLTYNAIKKSVANANIAFREGVAEVFELLEVPRSDNKAADALAKKDKIVQ